MPGQNPAKNGCCPRSRRRIRSLSRKAKAGTTRATQWCQTTGAAAPEVVQSEMTFHLSTVHLYRPAALRPACRAA